MGKDEPTTRREALNSLSDERFDVLIIGGGIVGAGIARDAALRGLRTALVEQYDFASGTSSRSSRLLHGGLRYLAQGRIGLVREASVEKTVVHRIAAHIAVPLAFVFPTYRTPPWGEWALWKLSIGVRIYDLLSGRCSFRPSRTLAASEVRQMLPSLNAHALTGAVRYYDGLTNDSRLVIDNLRSADQAGAVLLNYCRLEDSERDSDGWKCSIRDQLTGESTSVTARCIVNATGPWADRIAHSSVKLRPTKGVHLVVRRDRLPVSDAVVMTEDSRILFAIPWGERVILGTTDTDYSGPPEDVRVEAADIDYVFAAVNRSFPDAHLTARDLISTWAGVRPLIAAPGGGPSDISRSHEIKSPGPGWFDVAGGKLTTYRLMAEQATDRIEAYLGRHLSKCVTAERPILPADEAEGTSAIVPPEPSRDLVERFCRDEWAVHLDDVMLRRGGWAHYVEDQADLAVRVAGWMAEALDWDAARESEELNRYRASNESLTLGT